jgi:hypothetical protein
MLSENIVAIISEKLQDGTAERIIAEQFEKTLQSAVQDILRDYGDVGKVLKEKIKSVILPMIEGYDYQQYIIKLDAVLMEVVNSCTIENRKILKNFGNLVSAPADDTIEISKLWETYKKYVAAKVDTDGLKVEFHDSPEYECVYVGYYTEWAEKQSWSVFERGMLRFCCNHDERLNFEVPIIKWTGERRDGWKINVDSFAGIKSLRYLDDFQILLMNLSQNDVFLLIDDSCDNDEDSVTLDQEPEASFS